MSSWRDQILNDFTPKVARLTLVADPDGLLLEGVYIDNLFVEGLLHSVSLDHADSLSKTWVGIGVRTATSRTGIVAWTSSLAACRHPFCLMMQSTRTGFTLHVDGRS